jgi:hypothetical protein
MAEPIKALQSGVVTNLVSGTTGTGVAFGVPSSFRYHNFMVTAAAGVTAGAVTIETTDDPTYAGTWAAIVPDKSIANPLTVGVANLLMPYTGMLSFVRARINTTISGGGSPSVTVTYFGAKNY